MYRSAYCVYVVFCLRLCVFVLVCVHMYVCLCHCLLLSMCMHDVARGHVSVYSMLTSSITSTRSGLTSSFDFSLLIIFCAVNVFEGARKVLGLRCKSFGMLYCIGDAILLYFIDEVNFERIASRQQLMSICGINNVKDFGNSSLQHLNRTPRLKHILQFEGCTVRVTYEHLKSYQN